MSEKLDITIDTANTDNIIGYTKNLTPICLKIKAKCKKKYIKKIKAKCIHSWKNITYQNPSQEEISILNFPLVSKTKTSYLELSRPRWLYQ